MGDANMPNTEKKPGDTKQPDRQEQPSVTDLPKTELTAEQAEQVKGGAYDLLSSKHGA
jgi:hypothetical protein